MGSISVFRHALIAVASAAAVAGLLPACGGDDGTDAAPEMQSQPPAVAGLALDGPHVSGRDEALQIVARGVVAPLYFSELAHAALAQALGAGAVRESPVAIEIEAADNAEGLFQRGEAGFVRALLRFERVALGSAARIDGAVALEVSRTATGAGLARRTQADALSVTDGRRTLNWSYLAIEVDAQQLVRTLNVVSDVPIDGSDRVWLDATAGAQRYIASGVIGFLKARLTLQMAADGGWTIEVDNDKDDRVDFAVQASADEARALMLGL